MSVEQQVDGPADDPGNAPEQHAPPLDDRPADAADKKPAATSRPLWLTAYVLVVVLIALRIPQAYAYLQGRVPAEMAAKIHDADMERLALKSGVFVAFVLTALAIGIFFSLAAVLERKLFTVGRSVGRFSFGLYFLVAALCTVPVQLSAVLFDIPNPRASLLYYMYIASVGLLAPFAFRTVWWRLPKVKVGILFLSTVIFSLLTSVG